MQRRRTRHALAAAWAASLALAHAPLHAQETLTLTPGPTPAPAQTPAQTPTPEEVEALESFATALENAEHLPDVGGRVVTIDFGTWQGTAVVGAIIASAVGAGIIMDRVLAHDHKHKISRDKLLHPTKSRDVFFKPKAGFLFLPLLLLSELALAARDEGAGEGRDAATVTLSDEAHAALLEATERALDEVGNDEVDATLRAW